MKSKILIYFTVISVLLQTCVYAYSTPSSWAVDEITEAIDENLVTDRVLVDYQANITREQFCELVVKVYEKINGKSADIGNVSFNDTTNSEILKAANLGIVNGYGDGIFAPNDLITREQIAAMLVRMIDKAVPNAKVGIYNNNTFTDSDLISDWALPSVNFAYDKFIMRGVDNNRIDPKASTTCEQAILLMYRVSEKYYKNDSKYELPMKGI